jgi:hypothetical protein
MRQARLLIAILARETHLVTSGGDCPRDEGSAVKRAGEPPMQGSGEPDAGTDDSGGTFLRPIVIGGTHACGSASFAVPSHMWFIALAAAGVARCIATRRWHCARPAPSTGIHLLNILRDSVLVYASVTYPDRSQASRTARSAASRDKSGQSHMTRANLPKTLP